VKKTQWGKKNILLVSIVVILAIAVFFDYSTDETNNAGLPHSKPDTQKTPSPIGFIPKNIYEAKLKRNQQIIDSEDVIHKAYASIAIPYAMAMAEFETFKYDTVFKDNDAEQLIRSLLPDDGSVITESLSINNKVIENNTYQYLAMLKLKIYTHESALSVLESLGQYKNGVTWNSFSLQAHHKKNFFTLSGQLNVLFIKAVE